MANTGPPSSFSWTRHLVASLLLSAAAATIQNSQAQTKSGAHTVADTDERVAEGRRRVESRPLAPPAASERTTERAAKRFALHSGLVSDKEWEQGRKDWGLAVALGMVFSDQKFEQDLKVEIQSKGMGATSSTDLTKNAEAGKAAAEHELRERMKPSMEASPDYTLDEKLELSAQVKAFVAVRQALTKLESHQSLSASANVFIRSDIPVPGLYRLSADGTRLIGTDLSGSPIEGRTENEIQFVGINALLRGMHPAPVRGEPLRVALLRDEEVKTSSMDAAMLSLALMAQREYGVSAIEWVDPGEKASGGWRPFFAESEVSPLPTTLLLGPAGVNPDPPGVVRIYRDEAADETVVAMQIVEASPTRPGVFVRAVAKTNALARRIAAMLRAWWSPRFAQRSDDELQVELDTLVREQLSTYLDRNPKLASQERPHARIDIQIERGVNQMWVEWQKASDRAAKQTG